MKKISDIKQLEKTANKVRINILKMLKEAGCGHPGGSLSATDVVVSLYFNQMKHDPKNPLMSDRDRFVLSKGHAAPLLYCVLAECGYFPEKELFTLRKINSRLQGHPVIQTVKNKVPGIELTTGSLGQGFSAACGIAKGLKIEKNNATVFALLGDGECQEGQIWEASMFAAHYKLDNLIAIVDNNGLQIDGSNDDVMRVNPL
ncbi:MAG: transketolase, partial [Nanoarchaeota archaeon]|nr:transketolase [Nanoarchaeota archaeon]